MFEQVPDDSTPSPAAEERVPVSGDTTVLIRPIRTADAPLLAEAFARLSPRSRRLRFLGAKSRLTASELRYLTDVDQDRHLALIALDTHDGRLVGVARHIRDTDDGQVAEVAVTVVDEWHRRGVGGALLRRLIGAAVASGIGRYRVLIAPDNVAMRGLLTATGFETHGLRCGAGVLEGEIPLPPAAATYGSARHAV